MFNFMKKIKKLKTENLKLKELLGVAKNILDDNESTFIAIQALATHWKKEHRMQIYSEADRALIKARDTAIDICITLNNKE